MSNFEFLNKNRVTAGSINAIGIPPQYWSTPAAGFNGMFRLFLPQCDKKFRIIAGDGEGWQHVSVSIEGERFRTPTWGNMCQIKDLFWEDEHCVIQFHPPKSDYVNHHPGVLHLWRCTDGREQPRPPSIMVGPK